MLWIRRFRISVYIAVMELLFLNVCLHYCLFHDNTVSVSIVHYIHRVYYSLTHSLTHSILIAGIMSQAEVKEEVNGDESESEEEILTVKFKVSA